MKVVKCVDCGKEAEPTRRVASTWQVVKDKNGRPKGLRCPDCQ